MFLALRTHINFHDDKLFKSAASFARKASHLHLHVTERLLLCSSTKPAQLECFEQVHLLGLALPLLVGDGECESCDHHVRVVVHQW